MDALRMSPSDIGGQQTAKGVADNHERAVFTCSF